MSSNSSNNSSAPQQALIFIPDISGFTKFVTDTEINHAKHIIEELLEILIDSNQIGLEVSEIEGDAILFYRFGKAPSSADMLRQVEEMFSKFHTHLKKYEKHRICNCGACCTASKLAVKFIAHYGQVSINTIRQYKKLFGKDVIVAHRLLKNDIDSHEYSLFTENLLMADETWNKMHEHAWDHVKSSEQEYDSGKVGFTYLSLHPLKEKLPELTVEDFSGKGMTSKALETSVIINAPLELVFNVASDITFRPNWIKGPGVMEEFTDINSVLPQSGQTHKCIANGPVIVSHDYDVSDHFIAYRESDGMKSVVYELRRIDDNTTSLKATMFIKKNFIMGTMFSLFMKKKVKALYDKCWQNLKLYCEKLVNEGKEHPFKIQLKPSVIEAAA